MLPVLLVWATRVLIWRVKLGSTSIRITRLTGTVERAYAAVSEVKRLPGQLRVSFEDGSSMVIPSIIGDLDKLCREIETRRAGGGRDCVNGS